MNIAMIDFNGMLSAADNEWKRCLVLVPNLLCFGFFGLEVDDRRYQAFVPGYDVFEVLKICLNFMLDDTFHAFCDFKGYPGVGVLDDDWSAYCSSKQAILAVNGVLCSILLTLMIFLHFFLDFFKVSFLSGVCLNR